MSVSARFVGKKSTKKGTPNALAIASATSRDAVRVPLAIRVNCAGEMPALLATQSRRRPWTSIVSFNAFASYRLVLSVLFMCPF